MGPAVLAQEPYEPIVLNALEAQEAAADILDTYERIFKEYSSPGFAALQSQIDLARGALFSAPEEDLATMGELMGGDLLAVRHMSRQQAGILLARDPGGPFPDLPPHTRIRQDSTGFPTLNADLPAYPGFNDSIGVSESEIESQEAGREDDEVDRENDELGGGDQGEALVCINQIDGDGRVVRVSPGGQAGFLIAVKIAQLIDGVLHDFCSQSILGFNCNACCVISTIIRVLAEALYEAHQLCEGLRDGAEIEAAYQNGLRTFEGVEHVHGDLETHAAAISSQLNSHSLAITSQLTAHDTNITNQLVAHDTKISNQVAAHDTKISNQVTTHDTDIKGLLGNVQGSLDNEVEKRRVHLDVVEIQDKKRYVVVATEAGEPVDVVFTQVAVSSSSTVAFVDVTASTVVAQVGAGTYELLLDSPPAITDLISISVRHDDIVDHFGQVVFHRVTGSTKAGQ